MTNVIAIVPAGGVGLRMGHKLPKQFLELAGRPILVHSLQTLQKSPCIKSIIIAAPAEHLENTRKLVSDYGLAPVTTVVAGGETRQESVRAALDMVPDEVDLVLVHDGVRPLVTPELIESCVTRAEEVGAAMIAVPVTDTLKAEDNGQVKHTVDRRGLWQAQTPQAAETALLKRAFALAAEEGFQGTDEASILERIGAKVSIVQGSEKNIKVTNAEDLKLAEALCEDLKSGDVGMSVFRVGHGFDAHKLVEGRPLVLGGEVIPHDRGLLGHSDADVLVHALCDALLGAAGLGDIGQHFPDSDPAYKGISSIVLLGEVGGKVYRQGFRLINADMTLIAQRPKLSKYFPAMIGNIRNALGVTRSCLNLKATTTEQMGFTGRDEGMAAQAVVCLMKKDQVPLTD